MAPARNGHRALGTAVVGAAVTALLIIAGLATLTGHQVGQRVAQGAAQGEPVSIDLPAAIPGMEHAFVAGSYQELATYASPDGARRIFSARSSQRPTWSCVGLELGVRGTSLSCAPTEFPDGVMHVFRTIAGDERLLSGTVVPAVTQVSLVESSGRTTTVPVTNGTFLFSGTSGEGKVRALNKAGDVLFEKPVHFSG